MKKLFSIITFIALTAVAIGQTPDEIVSRMEAELAKHNKSEGFAMTLDLKMIIIGTVSSRIYTLGDKTRLEGTIEGNEVITWKDGVTEWNYDSSKNEIEITNVEPKAESESESDDNMKLFSNVTEGYDVKIDKETPTEWHLRCKKSKSNPKKDDPKKMDLVVEKDTYWPVSLTASLKGVTMTIREITYGLTEEQVTFDPKAYPNAKIVDKR
jgi:outer membrane lipoprotein-sorting protein